MDFETKATTKKSTKILFPKESAEVAAKLKKLSQKKIAEIMDLSDKLAKLNYDRFQNFGKQPKKICVQAYKGDVYEGLKADDFTEKDFAFSQENLRILSGLYGLLRPLDLIEPYRLEMGIKELALYKFWGDKLTKQLGDEVVINLASTEYSSAVKPKNAITVNFYEIKNGKPKIIGLFAKKARGMMARYIIKNQITSPEKIKKFSDGGYKFDSKTSTDKAFNFSR